MQLMRDTLTEVYHKPKQKSKPRFYIRYQQGYTKPFLPMATMTVAYFAPFGERRTGIAQLASRAETRYNVLG